MTDRTAEHVLKELIAKSFHKLKREISNLSLWINKVKQNQKNRQGVMNSEVIPPLRIVCSYFQLHQGWSQDLELGGAEV